MNTKKFAEVMDHFYDINNLLEMCYGYAQSDTPSAQALSESLYVLKGKYDEIYNNLLSINEVK